MTNKPWDADYREIETILTRMERDVSENLKGNSLRSKLRIAGQLQKNDAFCGLRLRLMSLHRIDPRNPASPFHSKASPRSTSSETTSFKQ